MLLGHRAGRAPIPEQQEKPRQMMDSSNHRLLNFLQTATNYSEAPCFSPIKDIESMLKLPTYDTSNLKHELYLNFIERAHPPAVILWQFYLPESTRALPYKA